MRDEVGKLIFYPGMLDSLKVIFKPKFNMTVRKDKLELPMSYDKQIGLSIDTYIKTKEKKKEYIHSELLNNIIKQSKKEIRTRNETFLVLIGCGGNRDREKRSMMGKIASELCDKVIFTSDNPRNEDPSKIISDMMEGVAAENYNKTLKISLREEAIMMSKQLVKKGDIVLIAGKGHESYQEIDGKLYPFNDLNIAKKYFKAG